MNWPVFISRLPKSPIAALCVYDSIVALDGRIQQSGEVIEHPGIQIRVRDDKYPDGYAKAKEAREALDGFKKTIVTHDSISYTIHTVKRTTGILPLGENPETSAMEFTINAIITISDSS